MESTLAAPKSKCNRLILVEAFSVSINVTIDDIYPFSLSENKRFSVRTDFTSIDAYHWNFSDTNKLHRTSSPYIIRHFLYAGQFTLVVTVISGENHASREASFVVGSPVGRLTIRAPRHENVTETVKISAVLDQGTNVSFTWRREDDLAAQLVEPCPSEWWSYESKCVYKQSRPSTADTAASHCKHMNATLLVLDNAKEEKKIIKLLNISKYQYYPYQIV